MLPATKTLIRSAAMRCVLLVPGAVRSRHGSGSTGPGVRTHGASADGSVATGERREWRRRKARAARGACAREALGRDLGLALGERGAGAEELVDSRERQRLREVEALAEIALEVEQPLELVGPLDALGDRAQLQDPGELDDRRRERGFLATLVDAVDEGLVDLEDVDGEATDVVQA